MVNMSNLQFFNYSGILMEINSHWIFNLVKLIESNQNLVSKKLKILEHPENHQLQLRRDTTVLILLCLVFDPSFILQQLQPKITCSKSTIETSEQCTKSAQS